MTIEQKDGKDATEFSAWTRGHLSGQRYQLIRLTSYLGYRRYNIDLLWGHHDSEYFILVEEKRHMGILKPGQQQMFCRLQKALLCSKTFIGFFVIRFENTSPEDGNIYISLLPLSRYPKKNWYKHGVVNKEREIEISPAQLIHLLERSKNIDKPERAVYFRKDDKLTIGFQKIKEA